VGLSALRSVEGWVPRGEELRTRSELEGSSRKEPFSGDAGQPNQSLRSRLSRSGVIDRGRTAITPGLVQIGPVPALLQGGTDALSAGAGERVADGLIDRVEHSRASWLN